MSDLPSIEALYDVCGFTWPAAAETRVGPWMIRDGQGGGQRVSAATREGEGDWDFDAAEAAMSKLGQPKLFMVRQGETELDAELELRGYQIKDPVNFYACPIAHLTDVDIPRVTAFTLWEPLQIMRDIWAAGGIDDARYHVMQRSTCTKTALLGRWNDQPAGTGYVAIYGGTAMVHALEILEHQRGMGVGKWMMRRAAVWAEEQGAGMMSVICTQANDAANALYTSLGMTLIGRYHYRIKND
ncbi:MAG: GNAT family N-acetyltransferase [Planktotalea sp.]|uniref:GNAT family N-acetyltransferase n=1 Tax=Planktotalea sp. TaxID=2029877 RepID=UPI003C709E86